MKRTAFHALHQELGAKLVEFAGYEMPVQYTGIIEEHLCVRNAVGMFDVSHMGEIEVRGKGAAAFVQNITVNDVSKLADGKVQYSAMCYEDGGIVDDLLVYHMGDHFMLVVNASNIEKDFAWMQSQADGDIQLHNKSDDVSLLAIQGPKSIETLQKLTDAPLSTVPYYNFVRAKIAGIDMIASRTGYTGEVGFEIYFPADLSVSKKVWTAIMEAGREFGIKPVGLGARDTLRLEMGFRLYGNDIDKSTNPLEAGLGWITKLDKGEFVGRESLLQTKQKGLQRKLVGFVVEDEKAVARHGYEIRNNGSTVGVVTSGTVSPSLKKNIGMGYVPRSMSEPGAAMKISIRGIEALAKVTPVPFIKK